MTSRCTLYLCTDGSPDALSIGNGLYHSLFRVTCERAAIRIASSGLHPAELRDTRWTSRCSITANSSTKFAWLPSLDVNSPPKEGAFSTRDNTPRKIVPRLGTSAFRDNGTSRESSATHVSRANSRHVFVLNSAAVEKMSYVIELKARVEQRCHPWITVWWASPYFFFFMIFVSVKHKYKNQEILYHILFFRHMLIKQSYFEQ